MMSELITVDGQYTFCVGETFNSYDQLSERMERHSSESFVCYWRRDSRTVKGAFRKTTRQIASHLKYYSVRYACVFGGQVFRSRGHGQRQTQTMRTNCPSFIMLRASKCGQKLEVTSVCNEHNHEISEIASKCLPQNRKLPDHIKQDVLIMLSENIDRQEIIEFVRQKTNKHLTQKDLHNLQATNRTSTSMETIKNSLIKGKTSIHIDSELEDNSYSDDDDNDVIINPEIDPIQETQLTYTNDHSYQSSSNLKENVDNITLGEDSNVEYNYNNYDDEPLSNQSETIIEKEEFIAENEEDFSNNINLIESYNQSSDKTEEGLILSDYECEYLKEGSDDEIENSHSYSNNDVKDNVDHYNINVVGNDVISQLSSESFQMMQKNRNSSKNKKIKRKQFFCSKNCHRTQHSFHTTKLFRMQIEVLKAKKKKLLEETEILRLTKEKLIAELSQIQKNFKIETI